MKNTIRLMMAALCLFATFSAFAYDFPTLAGSSANGYSVYSTSKSALRSSPQSGGVGQSGMALPQVSNLGGSLYSAPVTAPFCDVTYMGEPTAQEYSQGGVVRPWREREAGSHDDDPGTRAPIGSGLVMLLFAAAYAAYIAYTAFTARATRSIANQPN